MVEPSSSRPARVPPTILVVDDDEYIHGTLRAALRGLRPTLIQARTAADGFALATEHRPELAILDVGLPDASGYELARRLRGTPGLEGLRILILTGYEPDPAAGERAGSDGVLGKPFRLHEFLAIVDRLLERASP